MKKTTRIVSVLLALLMLVSGVPALELSAGAATLTIVPSGPVQLSGCTITLTTTSYVYDGNTKKPGYTVKNGSTTLTKDKDFTVSYQNNENPGTAKVVFKGIGSYTGTVTKTFTIKKNIASAVVTIGTTAYTYDGTAKKPGYTIKYAGTSLVNNTDFTVAYKNNVNAGLATVVFTGKGNFGGTKSVSFRINPKSIKPAAITVSPTSYVYDGKAKTPAVTVKDGTKTLVKDTDYTVTYSNNTAIGTNTAKASILGINNYCDKVIKTFTITKRNVANCTVVFDKTSFVYNGKAIKPSFSVKDGSTSTLAPGSEYIYTYQNNTNAGTAKVVITGQGAYYSGTKTATFTISPKSISGCTLSIDSDSYTYSGSAIVPVVTVTDGSATVASSNYTVSCTNNVNAGTATVTVTAKNNYSGTLKKTFKVNPKSISNCTITVNPTSYTYDGAAKTPAVTIKDGSKTVSASYYTVSYANNVNAGNLTVTIQGKTNYTGKVTKTVKINPKSITACTITVSPTSYTYNGTARKPSVTIKDGDKTLTTSDYSVTYTNNVNVGNITVTIQGKANYTGKVTKTVKISPKSISGANFALEKTSYVYNVNAIEPAVTLKDGTKDLVKGKDYKVEYKNNVNVGTATVIVTGIGNYTGSKTAGFTITVADIAKSDVSAIFASSAYVYEGKEIVPKAYVRDRGNMLTEDIDYIMTCKNNLNVGKATVTFSGKGNYKGTRVQTFDIIAADISKASASLGTGVFIYDGTPKIPKVNVVGVGGPLVKDKDYTLTFKNNVNIGDATVIVTGKGNFNNTKEIVYHIIAIDLSTGNVTLSADPTQYTYDGNAKTPAVTVKYENTTLKKDTDYKVSYKNNTNAGTATVTVNGIGSYKGAKSTTFKISAANLSGYTLTVNDRNPGKDNTPGVTVKKGSKTLTKDTDYSVSYADNTSFGTATVTVTGKKNYTGTLKRTYAITLFTYGRDNWNYTNWSEGTNPTLFVSAFDSNKVKQEYEAYDKVIDPKRTLSERPGWVYDSVIDKIKTTYGFSDGQNSFIKRWISPERCKYRSGTCSGMVRTAILLIQKDPKFTALVNELNGKAANSNINVHDLAINANTASVINYLHHTQNCDYYSSADNKKRLLPGEEVTNINSAILHKKTVGSVNSDTGKNQNTIMKKIENEIKSNDRVISLTIKYKDLNKKDDNGKPVYYYHSIMAYGIEEANYSFNGKTYDRRVLIYDPNDKASLDHVDTNDCIYFSSEDYSYVRPCNTNNKTELYWTSDLGNSIEHGAVTAAYSFYS